jgi:hypothetical protein
MCRRRIVETSDVRLTPRRAAAPPGPPITQFVSASARHRAGQEQRKALPARPGPNQAAAAPQAGVRRVAAE